MARWVSYRFSAGWGRAFDHRFEHLRGHDHGLAHDARGVDDVLLQRGNFFGIEFHAQIAARDHHTIGQFENFAQSLYSLRLFNLGAQGPMPAHQAAGFGQIFGTLDKRQGNPVCPMGDGKGEILAIFFGQGRDRNFRIGHVDALAIGYDPANFDRAEDGVGIGADHPQANFAVVNQEPLPLVHQIEEFGVRQADARVIARFGIAIEREMASVADHSLPVGKSAHAQFGALQVAQNRDGPVKFLFQRADRGDGFGMRCMIAVAHIDAEGVDTCQKQAA